MYGRGEMTQDSSLSVKSVEFFPAPGENKGLFHRIFNKLGLRFFEDKEQQIRKATLENGTTMWLKGGQLHREDGPAEEDNHGSKKWYWEGKLHREDGPAVEYSSGRKEWWINGKQHRIDGPAVEYPGVLNEWWTNGQCDLVENLFTGEKFDHKARRTQIKKTTTDSSNTFKPL